MGKRERSRLKRACRAGNWLTIYPSVLNGTNLSADEFRDNLRLRYDMKPLHLQPKCDGCGETITVQHCLSCKVGGLVHIRHDDVASEFGHLCAKALSPGRISYEPLINICRDTTAEAVTAEANQIPATNTNTTPATDNKNRGDVKVAGFWRRGTDCILDVRVTDTDSRSYRNQDPEKVLRRMEEEKKSKHLQPCLERRRHFTPLVYSVDGMAGQETRAAERRVASLLAAKWGRQYSQMAGWVRARMAIAVVRSNTMMLRGSRVRTPTRPFIEDGAAMDAWRTWGAK